VRRKNDDTVSFWENQMGPDRFVYRKIHSQGLRAIGCSVFGDILIRTRDG